VPWLQRIDVRGPTAFCLLCFACRPPALSLPNGLTADSAPHHSATPILHQPQPFRVDLGRIDARHSKSYDGDGMNRLLKLGLILAGYAAALLLTCAAFYVRGLLTRNDTSQASAGMQAFGELILFVGMFGVLALAPTALALFFLRPFEKFWTVFSLVSLAFAATGPVAAAMIHGGTGRSSGFSGFREFWEPLCLASAS